jgi:hypothetical protein
MSVLRCGELADGMILLTTRANNSTADVIYCKSDVGIVYDYEERAFTLAYHDHQRENVKSKRLIN